MFRNHYTTIAAWIIVYISLWLSRDNLVSSKFSKNNCHTGFVSRIIETMIFPFQWYKNRPTYEYVVGLVLLCCIMPAQPYITLRVRGGSNRYSMVVPDSCEALISKHTVPGETPEKIIVDLQSAVQREKLHASFEFAVEKPFYPSFLLNDNLEEICRLRHIFEEVTGEELKLVCSDGVSDNNHWSTIGGIPSVCFGPGGKGLHQSDEWVSTEQMENVLEVYLRFFLEDEE